MELHQVVPLRDKVFIQICKATDKVNQENIMSIICQIIDDNLKREIFTLLYQKIIPPGNICMV